MSVKLTITEQGAANSEYVRCFLQDRIIIGRARSSDVCLPDMAVSTRQAEIRLVGNDYAIVDLGSLNGTRVGGKPLVAHRPKKLHNGDVISITTFRLHFNLGVSTAIAESRDASIHQARQILAAMLARSGQGKTHPELLVISGPSRASRFALKPAPSRLVVGRGDEVDISLEDGDVSRRHLEILHELDGFFIRDLGSRNGVTLEGKPVTQARLEPGMRLTIGQTTMVLDDPAQRSLSAIFEAPEEETSSFSYLHSDEEQQLAADSGPAGRSEQGPVMDSHRSSEVSHPPIGPADPLSPSKREAPPKTTGPLPIGEVGREDRSDLGLIIIGAIIVVAAVIGLVYLFT